MASTFFGLQSAYSALQADQTALNVVGQNIENVNTPGYSRQTVQISELPPYTPPAGQPGQLGTGIEVSSITRVRDDFLDQLTNNATSQQSAANTLSSVLQQVQSSYNESSGNGLSEDLTSFFNAFSTLSTDPENGADRATLIDSAQTLTSQFQSVSSSLSQISANNIPQINTDVQTINGLATQIASLNNQIQTALASGDQPNDLEDQRGQLLSQLSGLVNIQTTALTNPSTGQPNGVVNVSVGGFGLVQGSATGTLPSTTFDENSNNLGLITSGGQQIPLTGGSVYGLIKANSLISGYQNNLNTLASNLASSVNSIQESGYGLDGSTGVAFFTPNSSSPGNPAVTAANITVNSVIVNNPNAIAAATPLSPTPAPPNPPFDAGNGDNATAIANLANTPVINGQTLGDYYNASLGQVGSDTQYYQNAYTNQSDIVTQLQNQQSSISGVNLDDELTLQLQYQQAYQAATQVLNTANAIVEDIINAVGGVTTTSG